LADKHLWVTQYDDDEEFPAGEYPNQNPGGEGLPEWTEQDRSVEDEDVVVWYNLNQTHVCTPEDWPVLPAKMMSFKLEPTHFFEENPAIDVPPEHDIKDVEQWKTENQESFAADGSGGSDDD
jgi:primary-amine oxidase